LNQDFDPLPSEARKLETLTGEGNQRLNVVFESRSVLCNEGARIPFATSLASLSNDSLPLFVEDFFLCHIPRLTIHDSLNALK
jgi:hypothetical protein